MISPIIKEHLDMAVAHIQKPVPFKRVLKMAGAVESVHKNWIVNETPKFYMQVSGRMRIDYPGGHVILDESDIVVFAPSILHHETAISSDKECLTLVVNFRNGRMQAIANGRKEMALEQGINDRDHLNPIFRPAMLEIMNLLTNSDGELSDESCYNALKSFLYFAHDSYDKTNRYEGTFPFLVEKSLTIIKDRVSDCSFNVIALAEELNCSPEHLSRLFSKSYGMPLKQYLIEQRLELAESILLGKGSLRISEIAYMSGFSSPGYFCSTFKKNRGMTAEEFRRKFS